MGNEGADVQIQNQPTQSEQLNKISDPRFLSNLEKAIRSQDLPVPKEMDKLKAHIEKAIMSKQPLLFQGETGSGKSLFSPQALLDVLGEFGMKKKIIVMQPRRDVAKNIAYGVKALAQGDGKNTSVGFVTGESKHSVGDENVVFVTPGILLNWLSQGKINKEEIGAILVDEMHESSIHYHLVLGLLKTLQEEDKAPFLMLTSATVNKELMQDYYGIDDENYCKIEGRKYDVKQNYVDQEEIERYKQNEYTPPDYMKLASTKVQEYCEAGKKGDILIFMPGASEIERTMQYINELGIEEELEVLPLHGTLNEEDRDEVLAGSSDKRRVIVCTNIAETSLTVPGVKLVIDSCRQRSMPYDPKTGIKENVVEYISKDQAEQRAGRAGRVQDGECIRLISESDYEKLNNHPTPEILRDNLSSVILLLKYNGIDPENFPFPVQPTQEAVEAGFEELQYLGALDENKNLTQLGADMQKMPFEPRISRMIIESKKYNNTESALVVAGVASENKQLFLRPRREDVKELGRDGAREQLAIIHNKYKVEGSDLKTNLKIIIAAMKNGLIESMQKIQDYNDVEDKYDKWLDENPNEEIHEQSEKELDLLDLGIKRARENFKQWCKSEHLNKRTMETVIRKVLNVYPRSAGITLDKSKIIEILEEQLNREEDDLGKVFLSAHGDNLLALTNTGGYLNGFTSASGKVDGEVNANPGSVAFGGSSAFMVYGSISEGKGTSRGKEIIRRYAQFNHPVDPKIILEILPHLVGKTKQRTFINEETGKKMIEYLYYLGPQQFELDYGVEELTGRAEVEEYISDLSYGNISPDFAVVNQQTLDEIRSVNASIGISIDLPDLRTFYAEKLKDVTDIKDIENMTDQLTLKLSDYIDEEKIAEHKKHYPSEITVNGIVLQVTYRNGFYGSDTKIAQFTISKMSDLLKLSDDDKFIDKVGRPGEELSPYFKLDFGWEHTSDSISMLKRSADRDYVNEQYDKYFTENQDTLVTRKIDVPKDKTVKPEELGYSKIQFCTNLFDEPAYLYPAIRSSFTGHSISYYRTDYEAQTVQRTYERSLRTRQAPRARNTPARRESSGDFKNSPIVMKEKKEKPKPKTPAPVKAEPQEKEISPELSDELRAQIIADLEIFKVVIEVFKKAPIPTSDDPKEQKAIEKLFNKDKIKELSTRGFEVLSTVSSDNLSLTESQAKGYINSFSKKVHSFAKSISKYFGFNPNWSERFAILSRGTKELIDEGFLNLQLSNLQQILMVNAKKEDYHQDWLDRYKEIMNKYVADFQKDYDIILTTKQLVKIQKTLIKLALNVNLNNKQLKESVDEELFENFS
jgi:HrpA-like RNA helicase